MKIGQHLAKLKANTQRQLFYQTYCIFYNSIDKELKNHHKTVYCFMTNIQQNKSTLFWSTYANKRKKNNF